MKKKQGRPSKEIDIIKMFELYSQGLVDSEIAKELEVDRTTICRRRQEFNLKANRKVGVRGPSLKDEECYWIAVRRNLKYIGKYIARAAREYYEETGDFQRYFISQIMEPLPEFHAIPGPHAGDPDKMNFKNVKYITDFEEIIERMGLAGCPGPAVIKLIKIYKSADEKICMNLAREAVETAGFVNSTATVEYIESSSDIGLEVWNPELRKAFWEDAENIALEWSPVREWPVKKIPKNAFQAKKTEGTGRTGKKGRGGGTQSINNTRAFQAAAGY